MDLPDCIENLEARNIKPFPHINSFDEVSSWSALKGILYAPQFSNKPLKTPEPVQVAE